MIALDTNILVYAHRRDLKLHERAKAVINALFEGDAPWAIPVFCAHEFLAVVTRIPEPTPTALAIAQVHEWLRSPSANLLHTTSHHLATLERVINDGQAKGGQIHDARIAAVCLEHGASELWTVDRDFARFRALASRNPLE